VPVAITADVARAAVVLRAGGLVAMPTETVYGLGASIDLPTAVARVYAVKGRPADHPLIVHIADPAELPDFAAFVPPYAKDLSQACWPGPLTLVLPKTGRVGGFVTGGQDTVAIRVPDHPAAVALLRAAGTGVAAPSANRFGRVSPTTAAHVAAELGGLLDPDRDLILDGGPTRVGLESTIVDCTGPQPRLLRPGGISSVQVTAITGLELAEPDTSVRAPGTLASHYAPAARVQIRADAGPDEPPQQDPLVGLIAPCDVATPVGLVRLLAPADDGEYAAGLYAALREADELQLRSIRVVLPAGDGLAAAIRDRVRRAAATVGG
jgi:L-threonylcarbamoyladenylate synthase